MRTTLVLLILFAASLQAQDSNAAWSFSGQGDTFQSTGKFGQAHEAYIQGIRIAQAGENRFAEGYILLALAGLHDRTDYAQACRALVPELLERAIDLLARASSYWHALRGCQMLTHHLKSLERKPDATQMADIAMAAVIADVNQVLAQATLHNPEYASALPDVHREWMLARLSLRSGATVAGADRAVAAIEVMDKAALKHSALQARLWLAHELLAPAHEANGAARVVTLATAAAESAAALGCRDAEYRAWALVARMHSDATKAVAAARASLMAGRNLDPDPAIEALAVLARSAPESERAAWQNEYLDTTLRQARDCHYDLLQAIENGNFSYVPTAVLAKLRRHSRQLPALVPHLKVMERLERRLSEAQPQPTAAQRAEFRKRFVNAVSEKVALGAAATMAELGGRDEVMDLLMDNLESSDPLVECAMAVQSTARAEHMPRLLKLAGSKTTFVAVAATTAIFRLVHEGARPNLADLLKSQEMAGVPRAYLLGALALSGDEAGIAGLRALAAASTDAEVAATAYFVLATLGDVAAGAELGRRMPIAKNQEFYAVNLGRGGAMHARGMFYALKHDEITGARAKWLHRQWRGQDRNSRGWHLMYATPRDRRDTNALHGLDHLQWLRDTEKGAWGDVLEWLIQHLVNDFPEWFADHPHLPAEQPGPLKGLGESELDKPESAIKPSADGIWLMYAIGTDKGYLSLNKKLHDTTLADNTLTVTLADNGRRIQFKADESFIRTVAAALDKMYDSATLHLPGREPLPMTIHFKGYSWADVEKPNTIGEVTRVANPERWRNPEYDGHVKLVVALPEPDEGMGNTISLEELAKAEVVVNIKLLDRTGTMRFKLSALRESLAELPDLAVTSFEINPASAKPNQMLIVTVNATNLGRSVTKAGNCLVRFYVKNPQYGDGFRVLAEQKFEAVGWRHGESRYFTLLPVVGAEHFLNRYSHTFVPEAGDTQLMVMIDPFDQCKESDKENNKSGRLLNWEVQGEEATKLAESDLAAALEPLLARLRAAQDREAALAVCREFEALFERCKVNSDVTRAALDMCRRIGNGVMCDLEVAATQKELDDAIAQGTLDESKLRMIGARLSRVQRDILESGLPIKPSQLDTARRATLALSRSAKMTNEAADLHNIFNKPDNPAFPAGAKTFADNVARLDNAIVLARWVNDMRQKAANNPDAPKPEVKDAVDAAVGITGLDKVLGLPKAFFGSILSYNERNWDKVTDSLGSIGDRISGKISDEDLQKRVAGVEKGFCPAQLGQELVENLESETIKKIPVIGTIYSFCKSWFKEDKRYQRN
ncbi:MAG: hypothetical protein IT464_14035 [Planctomycetes bacterium]|nr:hypothetical protein [Planctomycetota bacterium]